MKDKEKVEEMKGRMKDEEEMKGRMKSQKYIINIDRQFDQVNDTTKF